MTHMHSEKGLQGRLMRSLIGAVAVLATALLSTLGCDAALAQAPESGAPLEIDIPPPELERSAQQVNDQYRISQAAYHAGHDALAAERSDLALPYFVTACDTGNARGCYNVAVLVTQQIDARPSGAEPDAAKVKTITKALADACDKGYAPGCAKLVPYFRQPVYGMVDSSKALLFALTACNADQYPACAELAEMHYLGEGIPQNSKEAARLFKASCDFGDHARGCFNYAILIEKGLTRPLSVATPFDYYRSGCRHGSDEACINLAAEYLERASEYKYAEIAAGLLDQSCERGALTACTNLASLTLDIAEPLGDTLTDAQVTAAALYRKACDGGNGAGCRGLGNLAQAGVREAGKPRDAIGLFIKGCELGASNSCYNAGLTYWAGFKASRRPDLALQWFARGCDLNSASSCAGAALARLSSRTDTLEQRTAEARRWLDHARYLDPGNALVEAIGDWGESGADPVLAPTLPSPSAGQS